jgi:hypothetical protein
MDVDIAIPSSSVPANTPTDSAVAFVDLLGFSALVSRAHSSPVESTRLIAIMTLLGSVISKLDAKVDWSVVTPDMVPKAAQFSDTIVLVAPLRVPGSPWYNGLDTITMRCIQIAHIALDQGFLVRGGIDVGPIFRVGDNIAGGAYMNAYAAERTTKQPRIVFCREADTWWTVNGTPGSQLRIKYDNLNMVNVLHAAYMEDLPDAPIVPIQSYESHFQRYLTTMVEQSNKKGQSCKVRGKWKWMIKYLKHAMRLQGLTPIN